MGLVDPSILGQLNTGSVLPAAQQGYQFGQQIKQNNRQQEFVNAIGEIVQKVDYTTPEGQKQLIQGLSQKGFGSEAMALAQHFPKPAKQNLIQVKDAAKPTFINPDTKEIWDPGVAPSERKTQFAATADKWKGTKFVKTLGGQMKMVDAEGKDKDGNLVELYQNPDKPAVAASAASGIRANQADVNRLSARSAKNSQRYIGTRDALSQAEAAYQQYKAAPDDPGVRANQLEIVDKFTSVSANRPTTEGQFNFMTEKFPGIQNYLSLAGGKIMVAKAIPDAVIESMMNIMRQSAIHQGVNLKTMNATDSTAGANSPTGAIPPSRFQSVPNDVITSDSTKFANTIGGNKPSAPAWKIDLAKKALSDPKASPEHKAAAKKILGME